jgi:hypothetical protein
MVCLQGLHPSLKWRNGTADRVTPPDHCPRWFMEARKGNGALGGKTVPLHFLCSFYPDNHMCLPGRIIIPHSILESSAQ